MEQDLAGPSTSDSICSARETPSNNTIDLQICPTTGGQFDLQISVDETMQGLRKAIGKKLKLPREKISMLYRDKILKDGSLRDHNVVNGSKITLLPHVESGLMSQRPEQTVLNALENLSEGQVNDFLGGKSPLTLAMRLGDHMMFVQLQLSTTPPKKGSKTKTSTSKVAKSSTTSLATTGLNTGTLNTGVKDCSKTATKTQETLTSLPSLSTTTPIPATSTSNLPSSPTTASATPDALPSSSTPTGASEEAFKHTQQTASTSSSSSSPSPVPQTVGMDSLPVLDSNALAEASRNLSKKLKELSEASSEAKQQFQDPLEETPPPAPPKKSGAIIESMQHHGHGVYSGTFSGTLNPALQDSAGKPKKSISTIIHILNDLLGATPQYRAHMSGKSTREKKLEKKTTEIKPKVQNDDSRVDEENQAIRSKMTQLQKMMEERRMRRQQRRQARAPYSWTSNKQLNTSLDKSEGENDAMEVDANLETLSDQVTDTNDTYKMQQETIMA